MYEKTENVGKNKCIYNIEETNTEIFKVIKFTKSGIECVLYHMKKTMIVFLFYINNIRHAYVHCIHI
jgi:hypothetical protein